MRKVLLIFLFLICFSYAETVSELVEKAKKNNPELKKIEKELYILKEKTKFAGKLFSPRISISIAGSRIWKDPIQALELKLKQRITFPRKLSLEKKVAIEEYKIQYYTLRLAQLKVVREIKELAYRVWLIEQIESIIEKYRKELLKLYSLANVLKKRGKVDDIDLERISLYISMLEKEKIERENEKLERLAALERLVNSPVEDVVAKPLVPELFEDFKDLEELLRYSSPKLKAVEEELKKIAYSYYLAKMIFYPDFDVSIKYHIAPKLEDALEFSASWDLPIWKKFKEQEIVLREKIKEITIREQWIDTYNFLKLTLKENYIKIKKAKRLFKLIKYSILPKAKRSYELSLQAYKKGSMNINDVLMAMIEMKKMEEQKFTEIYNSNIAYFRILELLDALY